MKPRDLLPIVERVRRATTNGDVLTICDALSKRLSHELATSQPRSRLAAALQEVSTTFCEEAKISDGDYDKVFRQAPKARPAKKGKRK